MVYDHTTAPEVGRGIRIVRALDQTWQGISVWVKAVEVVGSLLDVKVDDTHWVAVQRWEYADEAPAPAPRECPTGSPNCHCTREDHQALVNPPEPPPAEAVIEEVASAVTRGNPKDVIGSTKASLATVFWPAIFELGLAMLEGECKYWRHNYLAAPVRATVYVDALHRHIAKWVMGEEIDPESEAGLTHLAKAAACVHILQAARAYGTLIDDRPPRMPDGWLDTLSGHAKTMIERLGQTYVRGAYTEAERARWPEFNEALSKGPIRKDGGK